MTNTHLPINIDELNAVYHRSYEIREPIEVRILPDCVTIASYPGPDGSVNLEDLQTGSSTTRRYRNRRIGEFLKELSLTEGRGTGIPKILRAIRKNGSPLPIFETNDDRMYFVARFPIHPGAMQRITKEDRAAIERAGTKPGPSRDQVETKSEPGKDDIQQILSLCNTPQGITDLMVALNWTSRTKFRNKYLNFLTGKGLLEMTIPDKPQSSLQRYRLTAKGEEWLAM